MEIGRVVSVNMLLTMRWSSMSHTIIFNTCCSVDGRGITCNVGARK